MAVAELDVVGMIVPSSDDASELIENLAASCTPLQNIPNYN